MLFGRTRFLGAWFLAALFLGVLVLVPSPAQAVSYGLNLIVNGNAEQGPSSSTGAPVAVPGWTTSSAFTVVPYNAPGGFPTSGGPGPPDRQNQFFAGGSASTSTATQEIDLTANASDINQGKVSYDLSGWLGGFSTDDDNATLAVQFFNGASLIGSDSIGPILAADRGAFTGLILRFKSAPVPINVTRVIVTLTMTRSGSGGSFNDGYADSLGLVLRAPFVVTTTADSGAGSLRSAVTAGNTITFDSGAFAGGPHIISLLTQLPPLNGNMTMVGPGSGMLTIQRSTAGGTPLFAVFQVSNGTTTGPIVSLSGLTIKNGSQPASVGGGGVDCYFSNVTLGDCALTANSSQEGGGIYNEGGTVVLNNCSLSGNTATVADAGGIFNDGGILTINNSGIIGNSCVGDGGGILNYRGPATLDKCTISGNSAGGNGGGLKNQGNATATLTNCTLSGNSAANAGGGILNRGHGSTAHLTLKNCTLSGNSAPSGGGLYNQSGAGNVFTTVDNTIFKTGATGENLFRDTANATNTITSQGYNLSNDGGGGFLNQTGDRINTDPMLGPLQNNGGPTLTHTPLPGSLAIDKGNGTLLLDQRNAFRPFNDPGSANGGGNDTDIGAVEFGGIFLRPTNIARSGSDIIVSFSASAQKTYGLDRKLNATDSAWQTITNVFVVSDGTAQITDAGGASVGKAIYRVRYFP